MDLWTLMYFSILSVLIPLSLALLQWKRIPHDISMLRWLLVAALISDVLGRILGLLSINNLLVGDVFMFIQFTILMYIFSLQFERKTPFKVVYFVIVLFYLISWLFLDKSAISFLRSNTIDSLVLITVSIVLFYKLLDELKVVNIHRLPILWIAFATLFYYSGNFFVFLASSYLQQNPDTFLLFWMLHNGLNIIKNLLFGVAIWQTMKSSK